MKKIFAILFIITTAFYLFAKVPHYDSTKYYPKTIVVCFDKQVLPDREGILNFTLENGNVKTGIGDFDKLSKKYHFVDIKQLIKHVKDLDWNDHGIYLRNIYKVFLKNNDNIEQAMKDLQNTPHILYAEYDPIMRYYYTPNDPMYPMEWHLPQIDAPQLWDYIRGDDDIVVGIVDMGIYFTHPDLKDNIWINEAELPGFDIDQILQTGEIVGGDGIDNDNNGYVDDVIGWNFKNNNNDAYQDFTTNDHGTHVAGCAAAVGDNGIGVTGVAMNLKLISSKHASSSSASEYIYDGIDGMLYCYDNGAKIVNCSFGGPGGGSSYNSVVNYGVDHGALTVVAAGNDAVEHNSSYHDYPADCTNALCVAATTTNDIHADFTDYGDPIDVAAPGVNIRSTIIQNDGYASYQGTSMASPITAGTAAMVLAVHPNLTPLQLRQRIMDTTDYIDDVNPDLAGLLGTGRINVFTAAMYDLIPKLTIDDYNLTEAEGNGDGIPNPGETLNFTMLLQNQYFTNGFWAQANNVQVHFSTTSPGVTLSNTDVDYGTIGQVGAVWNNDSPLVITTDSNIQDLTFTLHITIDANQSSEYPYHQEYDLDLALSIMQTGWPLELNGATESSPAIVDLNNDGTNEIVFGTFDGKVYATNGFAENMPGFPVSDLGSSVKTLAVSDVNGDGYPEIAAVTANGKLTLIDKDGNQLWQNDLGVNVKTNPMIATVNGSKKIIVVGQMQKIFVFNADGSDFTGYPMDVEAGTFLNPAIGDLNGDDELELVYFATNRKLHAITISTGQEISGWPIENIPTSTISGGILITTINNNPAVVIPLQSHVFAFDNTGNQIFDKDLSPEQMKGEVVSGDVNGDGTKDYVFTTYSGNVYAIDGQGNTLENFPVEMEFPINSTPILVDMDNDGASDILFGDNEGFFNSIDHTGEQTSNFPIDAVSAVNNSAAIGDTDNDGDPEILFSNQTEFYSLNIGYVGATIDWPTARRNNERWGNDRVAASSANSNNITQPVTSLGTAYPNPFVISQKKGDLKISYYLDKKQNVTIDIFNIKGEKINTITNSYQKAGHHIAKWNLKDINNRKVASGIYLYRLNANGKKYISKLVVIK